MTAVQCSSPPMNWIKWKMKKTTNNRKDPQKHSILLFFLSFDVSMNTPMKVYLNRRSHSFIDWRDEQKINVIKKLLCVEWVGCDLEFTSVSGINVGDCVHVRLYLCSVWCVPHLKKKDHFSEVEERKSEMFFSACHLTCMCLCPSEMNWNFSE